MPIATAHTAAAIRTGRRPPTTKLSAGVKAAASRATATANSPNGLAVANPLADCTCSAAGSALVTNSTSPRIRKVQSSSRSRSRRVWANCAATMHAAVSTSSVAIASTAALIVGER